MYLHIAPTPKVIVLYYDHLISLALWDTLQAKANGVLNHYKICNGAQSFLKFESLLEIKKKNRYIFISDVFIVLFMKTIQVGSILFLGAYKFHPSYLLTCDFIN